MGEHRSQRSSWAVTGIGVARAVVAQRLRVLISVAVAVVLGLVVTGVATAYFTSTGSGTGSATTGTLNAPTNVSGTQTAGSGTVQVSWTAPTGLAPSGYYVLRTPASGPAVAACGTSAASPIAGTSCSDTSVPLGSYTYTVVAVKASWTATSAPSATVVVGKAPQMITFTSSPSSPTFGGTYTVTATGGASGNPVTFSSATTGVCTVSGSTVSFVHAGTCTINADQAGSTYYAAAPQTQQSFTVAKKAQAISFTSTAPANAVVDGNSYTPAATGGASGNAVTFTTATPAVCTVVGGSVVTFQHVGTCTINANQAGNADYLAANQVQQSFTVGQGAQAISFTSNAPANAKVGDTYTVTATGGNSGNAVVFSAGNANCTVTSGGLVTFTAAGTCLVNANQAGNADYLAAGQVTQSITVTKKSQTITFTSNPPADPRYGQTYTVTATSSSGLPVSFTTGGSCSNSGATVTFYLTGSCTVFANQAGDGTYLAAPEVQQVFTINKADQVIQFSSTAPASRQVGGATYTPVVQYFAPNSGNSASITGTPGVCAYSFGSVSFIGVGTCTITAVQPGTFNYNASAPITQTITVTKGSQTITFNQPATPANAGTTATLSNATTDAGLTVTFTSTTTSVCTVSGTTVTYNAAGTCSLTASQPGNADYNAATSVTRTVAVQAADTVAPTITNIMNGRSPLTWTNNNNGSSSWNGAACTGNQLCATVTDFGTPTSGVDPSTITFSLVGNAGAGVNAGRCFDTATGGFKVSPCSITVTFSGGVARATVSQSDMVDGTYTFVVNAKDFAGNAAPQQTVTLTIT